MFIPSIIFALSCIAIFAAIHLGTKKTKVNIVALVILVIGSMAGLVFSLGEITKALGV